MNGPDRYRTLAGRATDAADGGQLGCLEGVDPVTGLPVLIYDFDGEPLAAPGVIDSPNIPKILWSGTDGERGRIVAALSPGWQRLSDSAGPLTIDRLLDAARALRDAASAGVVHGQLAPDRLLLVDGRLQIEGFGVPWRPRNGPYRAPEVTDAGTPEGDVYSLARTVGTLGFAPADETVNALLEQCMASDSTVRPSAEELYLALTALLPEPATGGAQRRGAPGRAGATSHRTAAASSTPGVAGDAAPTAAPKEPRNSGTAENAGELPTDRPRPPAVSTGPETARAPLPLPSEQEETRDKRVSLTLLGALMAAVILLAMLALYGPRGSAPAAPQPMEDIVYVVEVEVEPTDLPPVAIHVIQAPEGSAYARSDVIGTAPRHLALDRPGTWAFQGSLDGRVSEIVEIEVPEERNVTLVMPQAPGG